MTVAIDNSRSKRSLIPWIFVGAMAVVVIVNAVMITFAIRSWTGLVVEKPYERGVAYNRVLEAQHRQDALGWHVTVKAGGEADGQGRIRLIATGPDGKPLEGLSLTAVLVRPIDLLPDVPVAFRVTGPGAYAAEARPSKPGQWDLKIEAERGGDRFHLVQRLVLK